MSFLRTWVFVAGAALLVVTALGAVLGALVGILILLQLAPWWTSGALVFAAITGIAAIEHRTAPNRNPWSSGL